MNWAIFRVWDHLAAMGKTDSEHGFKPLFTPAPNTTLLSEELDAWEGCPLFPSKSQKWCPARNMRNLKKHVFPQWKTLTCPFLIHSIPAEIQRYWVGIGYITLPGIKSCFTDECKIPQTNMTQNKILLVPSTSRAGRVSSHCWSASLDLSCTLADEVDLVIPDGLRDPHRAHTCKYIVLRLYCTGCTG